MNTGQMLLTVLAVFLLTTVILTNTRGYVNNTETIVRTKVNLIAISIATSHIERASRLAFDRFTIPPNDTTPTFTVADSLWQLTAAGGLGPEAGDTGRKDTLFDDVDDYHGWVDQVESAGKDTFRIRSFVEYVDVNDPFGPAVSVNTWAKRITVQVWPKWVQDSLQYDRITMTKVLGYWRWR